MNENPPVRIAAIGDLHARESSRGFLHDLLTEINRSADVLVLCGDLTDLGMVSEAALLAQELAVCHLPILGVLGNHDYEQGKEVEIRRLLVEAGLRLLEDGPTEVAGVGFAGAKGFCGGFDKHMLQPWGERTIKQFVADAVAESMHLESALAKLRMERKLAVLHYAPVKGTVEGEPLEIYPYLGSSRMAEPLDHFGVSAVVHGHAHGGSPEARTARGIPVYNVALPLLRKRNPQQPFLVLTL